RMTGVQRRRNPEYGRVGRCQRTGLMEHRTMKDAHGYQLTGCNSEAQALLDQALAQFRCLHADSLATTEATLQASPELVMGHVLHAWLYLLGTEAAALPVARASYE